MSKNLRAVILILFFALILLSCFSCGPSSESTRGGLLQIELTGYTQTCLWKPVLSIKEKGEWRQVINPFSSTTTRPCYVDGKFYGIGRCDLVMCQRIDKPLSVQLAEYIEVGKKEAPLLPETASWGLLPMYITVPLHGEIKIEFNYFTDSTCRDEKMFAKIFNR